jgi:hypothetical protein
VVSISGDGGWNMEINQRIRDGKLMVSCLNSIWWDQYIAKETKERLGRCLVESVVTYGSELWVKNKGKKSYRQSKWATYDVVRGNRNRKEFAIRK